MSVEARLQALVQNYRAQHGDAALAAAPQLIANLSSQAPDLHGEIKALSAAIGGNAAARIAGSPDPEGEAGRIATEIAGAQRLSMAVATAGVAVARSLGQTGAAPAMPPAPAAADGGWAGESVIVQPAATAPPPQSYAPPPVTPGYVPPGSMPPPGAPASQPIYQNKIVLGAVAAAVGFLIYQQTRTPVQPTNQVRPAVGPQTGGPQGGGAQGGGMQGGGTPGPTAGGGTQGGPAPQEGGAPPMLSTAQGQAPTLAVSRQSDGTSAIYFQIQTQSGAVVGAVAPPSNGWEGAATGVGFATPGDPNSQITNIGSARLQIMRDQGGTVRLGPVQWQQGNGIGPLCVAFVVPGQAQDVPANGAGAILCIADGSCQRPIGCGRIAQ